MLKKKKSHFFSVKNARYVRINTLLVTLKKGISYFQEEGWSLVPKCSNYIQHLNAVKNLKKPNFIQDFHIPEILVFPPDTVFYDHPGYQNGEIILQDKVIFIKKKKVINNNFINFCQFYIFFFYILLG